ncbi:SgcJ/EcaC family oxidoreductase [Poseidonocella sp. HB161398]|uniref:YybH family protein n=1 Tax=Poseidonocella sp. HB161398 TaxID=2320855 RepID=UPI001486FA70|nr:SgcJ/EcaC family oxidoreductase [Poseidonocella sp. HB161398]
MTIRLSVHRAAVACALAAVLALPATGDDMPADVEALSAAWDAAFNQGDADAVAAMYAEDARVVAGDGTVRDGRAEIRALFQGFMDSGFGQHAIAVSQVKGTDDLVFMTGDWSGVGGDGNAYGGKIVTIHQRQADGSWATVLHMWN